MFRKIAFAAIAAASLGTAALAPTAASAGWGWHHHGHHHHHGHGHHHHGWRHYAWGPGHFIGGGGGCYVRRLVPTSFGPRWRVVNRCF